MYIYNSKHIPFAPMIYIRIDRHKYTHVCLQIVVDYYDIIINSPEIIK